jgi:hypothetical protein
LKGFKDPEEFVLTGKEALTKIKLQKKSKNGNILWGCRFAEYDTVRFVRKDMMNFLWPVESALFLEKLERRGMRMKSKIEDFLKKGSLAKGEK